MTPLIQISGPTIDVPTCCAPTVTGSDPANGTKFHFSLNVSDLERSIAFYRVLFGVEAAKHRHDYAKFELTDPPLVFSLVPNPPSAGGSLSHFGFPVPTREDVQAAAARLAAANLEISCQDGTVCGYARQDKVWVADPDRNYWEIYVVYEDVDPETVRSGFDGISPTQRAPKSENAELKPAALIWEHRVLMPFPQRIPHEDVTVDEVRLEGAFNADFTAAERAHLLQEALRVLRPGGRLAVHGLVSDRPLTKGLPTLPGVAALVRRVPVESEPLGEITAAGFESLRITKLTGNAVFQSAGAEMRELKFEGRKPEKAENLTNSRLALYKGPFAKTVDDAGEVFFRGQRTEVSEQTWNRLANSGAASQFLFVGDPGAADRACG